MLRDTSRIRTILLIALGFCTAWEAHGQFVVERSPWLDGAGITEDPVEQTWRVTDRSTNAPLNTQFSVEGINPRKPVTLNVNEDTLLKLEPYRRYSRLCVEPNYMLFADYLFADPNVAHDTVRLQPLQIGLETSLPAIEFMPGTQELYYTSVPALESLLEFIDVNPTLALAIIGCEDTDEKTRNQDRFSRDRARAVFEYLVSSGVASDRLTIEGRGSKSPAFPEPKTPEEAEFNRRISVRVTNY